MQSPYSRSKLVAYIVESLESGASLDRLTHEIAAYLIDAGKTSELESVMRDAQELRAQKIGKVELTAKSAHKIDAAELKEIKKIAKDYYDNAKTVTVHEQLDESVLGGVNLALPQATLDVSIRNKLNQLREAIS